MSTVVQKHFEKFHDCIRLNDTEDNSQLREKRDLLLDEIREYFWKKSERDQKPMISFSARDQGSYAMGTGVKPLDGADYDIDEALLFQISKNDYDPVTTKRWVFEALDKYPRTVQYKKPCVRVQYHREGEVAYHVDFACYADANLDGNSYLSKGKPNSLSSDKIWEVASPMELKNLINNKFEGEDKAQFKRIIRYLKRWKDSKIRNTENGKPTGIAITSLAYKGFSPVIEKDSFSGKIIKKDLEALIKLIKYIIGQFDFNDKITTYLPVPPHNDLFEKMKKSGNLTKKFKDRLIELEDALVTAQNESDPVEACKLLKKQFGDDFEVPDKSSTGQKGRAAVVGSAEYA